MTRYTVTWLPSAQEELAQIWIEAPHRGKVSDAANKIDKALASDPDQKGQEFYGDRLYVADPIAVTYSVHPDDRMVRILQVWHR